MENNLVIGIMCGGNGTRLWPLSNNETPKQFLKLTDKIYNMFQLNCLNALELNPKKIVVICNITHQNLAKKSLDELNITKYTIIGEPFGKNTAAAVASCSTISSENDNILILTSDHIWDKQSFVNSVNQGLGLIDDKAIIVFGIKPTYPETGYGYINYDENRLIKFVEKPNSELAQEYLNSGNYLWNSGIFLFNNSVVQKEFIAHAPDIYESVSETIKNSKVRDNIISLSPCHFKKVRSESIDYAIMEYHKEGKVIKYENYWNDIGSYKSLHQHLEKDENNNVIDGNVNIIDSKNCLIKSDDENKIIAVLGLDNIVIVNTGNTILVMHKDRCQDVKLFSKK